MIDNNTENNLPESIEDIHNKHDLVRYYLRYYNEENKLGFINLIIRKLEGLSEYQPQEADGNEKVGLNSTQLSYINQVINSNNSNDIKFQKCINELSFNQINYLGW